jgi:hypothetical protein
MAETTWDAELAAISTWAASYYPSKASSPPVAMTTRRFTLDDIVALFAATTSLKHHLTLVDQPTIRGWMEGPRATPVAHQTGLDSWNRLQP